MPDVWSHVQDLEPQDQDRLATVLETRGVDSRQQAMRRQFLATIPFPGSSTVLEVGCGTGVLSRVLALRPGVLRVTGVDSAQFLVERARELARTIPNLDFIVGDGRALDFGSQSWDVVIFDSTLCHIPHPEVALAEAYRVMRHGGIVAVFDGDYATTTVSLDAHDPLQVCVDAMMAGSVTDRWLIRRLPTMLHLAGFEVLDVHGYSYVESGESDYMLSIIDRGSDMLEANQTISPATAAQLKAEARNRVVGGTFFGHINYGSVVARRSQADRE